MYWGTSGSNDADHSGGSSGSDEPSVADSSAEGFVDGEATGGASAFGTTSASTSATGRASTGGGVVANQPRAVSAARTMASPAPVSTAQKERWVKTAHELFALANRCEEDASRWEALVDSHVEFIHPITPYRSFDSSRTRSSTEAGASAANAVAVTATEAATRCMVVGTQALMNDMQSLVVALGALLGTARHAQQPSNYQKDPLSARERTGECARSPCKPAMARRIVIITNHFSIPQPRRCAVVGVSYLFPPTTLFSAHHQSRLHRSPPTIAKRWRHPRPCQVTMVQRPRSRTLSLPPVLPRPRAALT